MPDRAVFHEVNDVCPGVIDHFIGQQRVVQQVKVALEAAWNDGIRYPHTLCAGKSGCGKTQLSQIISQEMGSQLNEQLAQNLRSPQDLKGFLLEAGDRDVLMIDECHELRPVVQVSLYRAMEHGKIYINASKLKRTHTITLANFTLIMATTDAHSLLKPLRDRFSQILTFEYYSASELEIVLRNRSKQLGWTIEEEVFAGIAARGRGVPRIALRLLQLTRTIARSQNASIIAGDHFKQMCELEAIDEIGLDMDQRRYLRVLEEAGGSVRLNIIAMRLGIPTKTVTSIVEEFLIRTGLVGKDDGGRFLTDQGKEHTAKYKQQ